MAATIICEWDRSAPVGSATQSAACFSVGAVSFACEVDTAFSGLWGKLDLFASEAENVDIRLSASRVPKIPAMTMAPAFDSGALWELFHDGEELVFDFTSPAVGSAPYKRMRVDRCFTSAHVTMSTEMLAQYGPVSPLEYPADELLITNHLAARGLGVEVHGCGLIDAESGGQLFLGHSGAGKSTTTRIWKTLRDPEVLSDDRIILRLHDGELWMYGTPWHGEAELASPGKTKLSRIFVLQHGPRNQVRALTKSQAAGEVFARSFPPFHSASGLESTLDFINRALDVVPCYEFQFVPDEGAINAVLDFRD
jgi:hypothetical protein